MTEAYTSLKNTLRFYGKVENGVVMQYGSQIPFNFELISKTTAASTSADFKTHIEGWLNGMPKGNGIHANWVVSWESSLIHIYDNLFYLLTFRAFQIYRD